MGATNKNRPYCKPWNAGLASETPAVCRRLGRLFDALDTEINTNIADGQIVEDVRQFRSQLQKQLLAEGWSMSYLGGNKMRVRPPGHKKPYGTEAIQTQPTEAQPYPSPDQELRAEKEGRALVGKKTFTYQRGKDGCDETWDIYAPDGDHLVSIPFWEEASQTEGTARMLVHRLNMHEELLGALEKVRSSLKLPLLDEATAAEIEEVLNRVDAAVAEGKSGKEATFAEGSTHEEKHLGERHQARKAGPKSQPNPHESKTPAEATTATDRDEKQTPNTERTEPMSEHQAKQIQSTKQQDSGKQQPLHKETHGAVQVMVWDNGPDREPTVSFGRPYRSPQGWGLAQSYRAKHLSDLMKATAAAALALGRELEPRPEKSARGKPQEVCAIDSGRFTAVVGARWNATAEAYTYGAKILCDEKQVFRPMLNHELAGLQRIAQEDGLPWLAAAVAKRCLPEPTTNDLQHFEKTLRASQALIGRFIEHGHKEVLKDKKVAEELGLDLSATSTQDREIANERSR